MPVRNLPAVGRDVAVGCPARDVSGGTGGAPPTPPVESGGCPPPGTPPGTPPLAPPPGEPPPGPRDDPVPVPTSQPNSRNKRSNCLPTSKPIRPLSFREALTLRVPPGSPSRRTLGPESSL